MSKLEQLMASEEGFGIAGAIPTTHNNPGDLTHAPGETHDPGKPNGVGYFATPEDGWAALERQLQLFADRRLTLRAAIYAYAPPASNNTEAYLQFLCNGLGCTPDILVSEALKIT